MQPEWDSPEVARATRASLGGCFRIALIAVAVLLVLSYLVTIAMDLL